MSDSQGGRPLRLSKARTWPLPAAMNNSRSSRGSARTGATLGSISARRSFDRTVFADPCSPATARTGKGPPARSAPNSHAATSTKSLSLATFKNGASASTGPAPHRERKRLACPRCGGTWPEGPRRSAIR